MRTVLLPVKDFGQAKQRLAEALEPRLRAGLARAMLSDVLAAISQARLPERVVVFTASGEVSELARKHGFEVIQEDAVRGHSVAVNRMVDQLRHSSAELLSLAGDLPTIQPSDIDSVFKSDSSAVRLVASRDGTGTNAALFVMPAHIQMEYGEGSLQRHMTNAAASGFATKVLNIPGIQFDVDTPEDFAWLLQTPWSDSETWRFIKAECVGRFR